MPPARCAGSRLLLEERRRLRQERMRLWVARERALALWMHGASAIPSVVLLLVMVSWIGDGIVWYAIVGALPFIGGVAGKKVALYMLALGAVNLVFYKALKQRIARPRPYVSCPDIKACARSLDEFSFPSGHTMHAVAFSMLLSHFYPTFEPLLWSFTALVAISRVVLGLHYPSDVVIGAGIAVVTAKFFLVIF
jgi:undecaprenyl-diphosphatase